MNSYFNMAKQGFGQASSALGQAHSNIKTQLPTNMQPHYTNFTNSASQLGSIASNCAGQNKVTIAGHMQKMGNAFAGVAKIGMQQAQNGMQQAQNGMQQAQNYRPPQQQNYRQPQQNPQYYRQGGKLRRHKKTKRVTRKTRKTRKRRTMRRH
jgi:hypothetical protein